MFDIFSGDINGQCLYDEYERWEDEEEDSGCEGSYHKNQQTEFLWFSGGKQYKLSEMTDKHVENSINYCNKRGEYRTVKILQDELDRRKKTLQEDDFKKLECKCQFCNKEMKVQSFKHKSHPDDGPGWGYSYTEYKLVCECGASGPVIKTEGIKPK